MDWNYIIDSPAGHELIRIDDGGTVVAADSPRGIGPRLLGMSKGTVKLIFKHKFNGRRWLQPVERVMSSYNRKGNHVCTR